MDQTIEKSQRIILPLIDLSTRRNSDVKECYLDLFEKHLEYKVIANYETEDSDSAIWTLMKCNYRWARLKSSISSVDMFIDNIEDAWGVEVEFHGVLTRCQWFFKEYKSALTVYNSIKEYFLR